MIESLDSILYLFETSSKVPEAVGPNRGSEEVTCGMAVFSVVIKLQSIPGRFYTYAGFPLFCTLPT